MRLSSFSILTGSGRVTVSDLNPTGDEATKYLITSGVVGSDIRYLQRGGQNRFWGFNKTGLTAASSKGRSDRILSLKKQLVVQEGRQGGQGPASLGNQRGPVQVREKPT